MRRQESHNAPLKFVQFFPFLLSNHPGYGVGLAEAGFTDVLQRDDVRKLSRAAYLKAVIEHADLDEGASHGIFSVAYRIGQPLQPWKLGIFRYDVEFPGLRVEFGELAELCGDELPGLVNQAKQGVFDADILGYVDGGADASRGAVIAYEADAAVGIQCLYVLGEQEHGRVCQTLFAIDRLQENP